jgi:hypothetical protein
MKNIFICYRRDDAEGYAGRLYDRLHARFPGRVFMDVTGIGPGADFTRVIQDRVGACHALVAVIGNEWLMMADENKRRRLFLENDYVRHEIATALSRNIPVIPVLVRNASMPSAESLPPDLAPLSFRNAIEITDPDFDHDVGRLIEGLEQVFGEQRPVPPPPAKSGRNNCLLIAVGLLLGGIVLVLLLLVIGFLLPKPDHTQLINVPSPAPTFEQTPEPEALNFHPAGSWTYRIGNSQLGNLDLHENHKYRAANADYANIEGTWSYSPAEGKLTLFGFIEDDETTHDAEITIERQSGNQFFGHITIEQSTDIFSISPR